MPDSVVKQLLHPVAFIALLMLCSVFFLIGVSIFNADAGEFLRQMGQPSFARGLITYLFAITTIGTAVVLVVAAFSSGDQVKANFSRGKDILSLLLGVFGTIVGFYFGTESGSSLQELEELALSPMIIGEPILAVGGTTELRAIASEGDRPYQYSVFVGTIAVAEDQPAELDGDIIANITIPPDAAPGLQQVRLVVVDDAGTEQQVEQDITVTAQAQEPLADAPD